LDLEKWTLVQLWLFQQKSANGNQYSNIHDQKNDLSYEIVVNSICLSHVVLGPHSRRKSDWVEIL